MIEKCGCCGKVHETGTGAMVDGREPKICPELFDDNVIYWNPTDWKLIQEHPITPPTNLYQTSFYSWSCPCSPEEWRREDTPWCGSCKEYREGWSDERMAEQIKAENAHFTSELNPTTPNQDNS